MTSFEKNHSILEVIPIIIVEFKQNLVSFNFSSIKFKANHA